MSENDTPQDEHPQRDPEIAEGKADEDVTPIEMQHISSLTDRRKKAEEKPAKPPVPNVPPPTLAVQPPDEEIGSTQAHVVEQYAVDELHPAEHAELAPPPEIHPEEHEAEDAQRRALEQTGLVTVGDTLTMQDIKELAGKRSDTKEKISALSIAVVVHVMVFFVLGLIVIAVPRALPPQIVALAGASDEVVPELEKKEVEKVTKPNPATNSQVDVLTVANSSAVAVPVVIDPIDTLEPMGLADDFGMAMNFGAEGAGNVSFFGSKAVANKVVFVVDSSASMRSTGQTGLTKHELMKKELSKTIKGLSSGVSFQILFFTGPSWFVGENYKDDVKNWKRSPKGNYWRYKDDTEESIRVGKYRQATPSTIRRTLKEIEETPIVGGTDWRIPLKMAMKMKPDVIYFMTDGAVGKDPDKPHVVGDVLEYNKKQSNAKINSICLMVPKAMDDMGEMSKQTRGELTLVLEDGTPLRGRELENYTGGGKKKKKK